MSSHNVCWHVHEVQPFAFIETLLLTLTHESPLQTTRLQPEGRHEDTLQCKLGLRRTVMQPRAGRVNQAGLRLRADARRALQVFLIVDVGPQVRIRLKRIGQGTRRDYGRDLVGPVRWQKGMVCSGGSLNDLPVIPPSSRFFSELCHNVRTSAACILCVNGHPRALGKEFEGRVDCSFSAKNGHIAHLSRSGPMQRILRNADGLRQSL